MSKSLALERVATERQSLAGSCAKAELRAQVGAPPLREVAADALKRVTSQKAAALDVGISEGRLSHKVKDGTLTLRELEALGPDFGRALGEECQRTYGAETADARKQRLIRALRQHLDELSEVS